MKRLKSFFNTLCVFTGNILRLKFTSWPEASKTAIAMVDVAALGVYANTPDGANLSQTPLQYLADSILNLLAFVLAVWLIAKIVSGFFVMLPYLLGVAVIAWLISTFAPSAKREPMAS